MTDKADWVVEGFQFATETDAELARNEKLRIERIKEKLDYSKPDMVNAVYKKAIDNRVFKTPVGYEFLKELQNILRKDSYINCEVADIPVFGVYSLRESTNPVVERVQASRKKVKKKPSKEVISKRVSVSINILLLALVALMFYISVTGSNPTVLNYERAVQNRYSNWEKELSDREAVIREKEKELLLSE